MKQVYNTRFYWKCVIGKVKKKKNVYLLYPNTTNMIKDIFNFPTEDIQKNIIWS